MVDTGFGPRVLQSRLNLSAKLGRTVTQVEVGKAMGVASATVGRWEAGLKEPSLDTIGRLAAFLQVPPGWLAFGNDRSQLDGDVSSVEGVPRDSEGDDGIDGIQHPPEEPPGLGGGSGRGKNDRPIK